MDMKKSVPDDLCGLLAPSFGFVSHPSSFSSDGGRRFCWHFMVWCWEVWLVEYCARDFGFYV